MESIDNRFLNECESENAIQHSEQMEDNWYVCRACDAVVFGQELNNHHFQNHPEIPMDETIFEALDISSSITNGLQTTESEFIKGQYYTCGACHQYVTHLELNHHHFKYHPEFPLDATTYEPFDTDDIIANESETNYEILDVSSSVSDGFPDTESEFTSGQQYTCGACHQYVRDLELNRHHSKYHSDIPLDANIYELSETNDIPNIADESEKMSEILDISSIVSDGSLDTESEFTNGQQYTCGACHQYVRDLELNRHHSKYHPDIPLEANIYEILETQDISNITDKDEFRSQQQKFICGVCTENVPYELLDRHHSKHHPHIPLSEKIF